MDESPDRSQLNPVVRRVLQRGDAQRMEQPPTRNYSSNKATDLIITKAFLDHREGKHNACGFKRAKWIHFCHVMLDEGFYLTLYEARETFSKYITVWDRSRSFKVRFSDHRPNKGREIAKDCDFFVGRTHLHVTNTDQAIEATLRYFRGEPNAEEPV
jgi:hypothetical protein